MKFILYNKKLVSRARELRKERTEAEIIFWNKVLKNKEVASYKFTQQKPLDDFIADFYCSKLLLVIEIDGGVHNELKIRDKERSEILLYKYGIKVVRYKNNDVLNNTGYVISDFKNQVILREKYLKLKGI
ncbi:MAG: endonuclease domain-containing protein [Candidatus Paceibacterota bacterium]